MQSQERIWPYTIEDVLEMLDTSQLQEIYNVVFASIDPSFQVNQYGMLSQNHNQLQLR